MSRAPTGGSRLGAALAVSLMLLLSVACDALPVRSTASIAPSPTEVAGLDGVIAVSAGRGFTAALKADGTVWTWGANASGQLGDGTTTDRASPVQVTGLRDVVGIASGGTHALALKRDGTVWAWGSPSFGGIGDATTRGHALPIQVLALGGASALSSIVRIAAGNGTSFALKSDGTVWAWGDNAAASFGDGTRTSRLAAVQLPPPPTSVVAIAVGSAHSLMVAPDGSAWSAGANLRGELCDGTFDNREMRTPVIEIADVIAVAAAEFHTLLLKRDGSVWACGKGAEGQLGDGTRTNRSTPVRVSDLLGCVAIAAGAPSLALDGTGAVSVWGFGSPSTPARLNGLPRIAPIAAADDHGVALTVEGRVWRDARFALKRGTVWAWGRPASAGSATHHTRTCSPIQISRSAAPAPSRASFVSRPATAQASP